MSISLKSFIRYQLVIEERLVGMYIILFCRTEVRNAIRLTVSDSVGCGLMGTLGEGFWKIFKFFIFLDDQLKYFDIQNLI